MLAVKKLRSVPALHVTSGRLLTRCRANWTGIRRKQTKTIELSVAEAPPHACPTQGCAGLAEHGQRACAACLAEKQQSRAARQRPAMRLYNASHWRKLSKAVLSDQPICMACHRRPSTQCDHIDGDWRNTTRANLQGLCHACHSSKTVREDGGFGVGRKQRP